MARNYQKMEGRTIGFYKVLGRVDRPKPYKTKSYQPRVIYYRVVCTRCKVERVVTIGTLGVIAHRVKNGITSCGCRSCSTAMKDKADRRRNEIATKFTEGKRLSELAEEYKVSTQRIAQIVQAQGVVCGNSFAELVELAIQDHPIQFLRAIVQTVRNSGPSKSSGVLRKALFTMMADARLEDEATPEDYQI